MKENSEIIKYAKDKDKLIFIANVFVGDSTKDKAKETLNMMAYYLQNIFDDSIKVLVMPVLDKSLQRAEIFNGEKCNEEILKKLNENYERIIESFSK